MNYKRFTAAVLAALLCVSALGGCTKGTNESKNSSTSNASNTSAAINSVSTAYPNKEAGFQLEKPATGEEIAVMHTSMGDLSIRFFPEAAPKAVENFKKHAKDGYYNGLIFHRIIQDFMIQGGDPQGTGTGGESIWGKPFEDEFDQKLLNLRGSLAMANSGPATNGSQFFINQASAAKFSGKETFVAQEAQFQQSAKDYYDKNKSQLSSKYKTFEEFNKAEALPQLTPIASMVPDAVWKLYKENGGNIHLDGAWRALGGHTVFAQVFEGMDIVDKIAVVKVDANSKPETPVTITSIELKKYQS